MIVIDNNVFYRFFVYGELIWAFLILMSVGLSVFFVWTFGFWEWNAILTALKYSIPVQILLLGALYLSKQEKTL